MPTYTYRCLNCKHEFDHMSPIANRDDMSMFVCSECQNKQSFERIFSGSVGLVFKGPGFYKTDYAKSDAKPASSSEYKSSGVSKDSGQAPKPPSNL